MANPCLCFIPVLALRCACTSMGSLLSAMPRGVARSKAQSQLGQLCLPQAHQYKCARTRSSRAGRPTPPRCAPGEGAWQVRHGSQWTGQRPLTATSHPNRTLIPSKYDCTASGSSGKNGGGYAKEGVLRRCHAHVAVCAHTTERRDTWLHRLVFPPQRNQKYLPKFHLAANFETPGRGR